MKYKKIGLIAIMTLFTMLLALGVSAHDGGAETVSWDNPNAATDVLGTGAENAATRLEVTTAGNHNVTNCSFYYQASDTNQSARLLIGTNSTTNNITAWKLKFNASTVEDTSNAVFSVTCRSFNSTNHTANITATQAARVDSSVPTAPTSLKPINKQIVGPSSRSIGFSATVTAADSTGCVLEFIGKTPGSKRFYIRENHSLTGTNCSVTVSKVPEGIYKFRMITLDGLNRTTGSQQNIIEVSYGGGAGKAVYFQQVQQESEDQKAAQNRKTLLAIIIIVVIVAMMKRKGKG